MELVQVDLALNPERSSMFHVNIIRYPNSAALTRLRSLDSRTNNGHQLCNNQLFSVGFLSALEILQVWRSRFQVQSLASAPDFVFSASSLIICFIFVIAHEKDRRSFEAFSLLLPSNRSPKNHLYQECIDWSK